MDEFFDKYIFPYTKNYFGRAKKTKDGLPIYSQNEELFNMISHIFGILIGFGMLIVSFLKSHSELGLAGGLIFGFSLIILYLASSVYHGMPIKNVNAKKLLRIFDHCSIFVLISGTCTPFIFTIISRTMDNYEWLFYAGIWLITLVGITLLSVDINKFKSIAILMYVVMSAVLVMRAKTLLSIIGENGTLLLIIGGIVYLVGLLFYGLGSQRKWMHSIFHLFCLVGSSIYCVCIVNYVI